MRERPTPSNDWTLSRKQLVTWAIGVEVATLTLAAGLAYLSGEHFWREIVFDATDVAQGCLAALPMLAVFFKARELREFVGQLLGPALARTSVAELLLISTLAGLCEEALFRGVLEPWIAESHWFLGFFGVNLIFGLLHAATRTYFILATVFGMYLSLLNWAIGEPNLLRAILCHAVYDFLAFLWLARQQSRAGGGKQGTIRLVSSDSR